MATSLNLDWETRSRVELKTRGLDAYSADRSTKVLMGAYSFDGGRVHHWDSNDSARPPAELVEALEDPHVIKKAWNAQFERVIARRVLKINTPIRNWRCTMALAYMQSFTGGLEMVGKQVGLPADKQKLDTGKKLIGMFSKPQKVSKKQPLEWFDAWTHPEEWNEFGEYNIGDVVSEIGIEKLLAPFPILDSEWELYELDQRINDRGLPVDEEFVKHAIIMSDLRKAELTSAMKEWTGVANPNSTPQLLPWLRERGYPFSDLRKDTVKKVLAENAELTGGYDFVEDGSDDETDGDITNMILPRSYEGGFLEPEAVRVLMLRQQAARTSVRKYNAIVNSVGKDARLRFTFQFAGASRTSRWSGRRFQPQNLARPPKELEAVKQKEAEIMGVSKDFLMVSVTEAIRSGDYEELQLLTREPMNYLAGLVRSSIRVPDPETQQFVVSDLSAIETCVTAWLSGCERLLNVVRTGGDPYIDFGTDLYRKPAEEVTKFERQCSKPAVLGCTYRLGGGELRDGKRTGLWGYAEAMGVNFTREESHHAVKTFRAAYPEIPKTWYALENAVRDAIRTRKPQKPSFWIAGRRVDVPVTIKYMKPYLVMTLPSGRNLYYFQPRITKKTFQGRDGEPYTKDVFSYMGKQQNGNAWVRVESHGGKIIENLVQAIARDVLKAGLLRAAKAGFNIIGHVHDEIITLQKKGDNYFTVQTLVDLMAEALDWAPGLPLAAAGYAAPFYRKD